jgi:glutamate synthase domain-containing protein 1
MIQAHPDAHFLTTLKHSCRHLIIDGPNCVVGCLPDNTVFMVQDRKKLRPGVVGGSPGKFGFASEVCGLDAALPDRDRRSDIQPMRLETVAVSPDRKGLAVYRQTDPLFSN